MIVLLNKRRPHRRRNGDQIAHPHPLAVAAADVQLANLLSPLTPLHLILHHHMIDTIVTAEIAGARAAERRLQAAEDLRHRHIQQRRPVAVDRQGQLRHVAAPVVNTRLSCGCWFASWRISRVTCSSSADD